MLYRQKTELSLTSMLQSRLSDLLLLCSYPLFPVSHTHTHTHLSIARTIPLRGKLINCLRLVVQQWRLLGGLGQRLERARPFVLQSPPPPEKKSTQSWSFVQSVESSIQHVGGLCLTLFNIPPGSRADTQDLD